MTDKSINLKKIGDKKAESSLTDSVNRDEILCNKSARTHEICMRFFIHVR